ncbi:hypothetical protein Pjdr2_0530 [Paenibacillus sp. JDR-2]|nr:hypothetical protein Pjdr2_0530 [Paenibacillus sp. JDR-2]
MFKTRNLLSLNKSRPASDSAVPRVGKRTWSQKGVFAAALALSMVFAGVIPANNAFALTRLTSEGGIAWEIHDSFAPNLDTGSIRSASSTPIQGFGNIFVQVSTSPAPRMNGQLMRDFGLSFDGKDTFDTTKSVNLEMYLLLAIFTLTAQATPFVSSTRLRIRQTLP